MAEKMVIQTAEGKLVDYVYKDPVDQWQTHFRRWVLLILLFLLLAFIIYFVWYFTANRTVQYSDIIEHFKYGSIGSETGGSVFTPVGGVLPPYWVFKALPAICPDKLPGGYASLGLVFEPGHDLPIGVSRRRNLGLEQVGLNCAVCHTGTVRASPSAPHQIVLGMPAHQLDLEHFFEFVQSCSLDDRVTGDSIVAQAKASGGHMRFVEKLLYKTIVIPRMKAETVQLQNRISPLFSGSLPQWGRGRVDTFNPYKAIQFNWNVTMLPPDELIGAADFPSLWNQQPREGMHLHWDGNNTSVDERNLSASLGAGVTPVTVDHASLQRIHDWIWTLPPPKYPFAIDQSRVARGQAIYNQQCADCHSFGGSKTGTVEPWSDIRTDPFRLNSYTYIFCTAQATLYPESQYRFTHFSKTDGYARQPLDGIWARAPYLHNGSVPTLWDLLQDPDQRPKQFIRGYDVYDQQRVGFVYDTPDAKSSGFLYDTAIRGNGNGGHEYGTKLSADQKRDLIEYMKTL